ncbi:CheR family methyltransferase [Candidatus Lucifugimonas marina]|uniref:Chemotaxis protein CheR n=1 Tax=Candidatus Lucifugimonas marina TaxID=3038979 RepID=A0AAJ5ZE37_9CHLR|nr:chemotaxis protein CheR [SAR202 cluster bacterium JH702]MDG0869215.1 chemotaxis protein CheR [SAR202 cluster bacterium JH639]WFG35832.1 chemotaxis protein CheR [SAR202 cluster bacterium JH545]WFG39777.1 chemotaxis protein CheR [SAR202 cluster bacterium JH1073]
MNDAEYKKVTVTVKKHLDLDLDFYKPNQMMRRLAGFISRVGAKDVNEFCSLIESDADVREKVMNFMTINVTEFFRDTRHFEMLRSTVLPEILRKNPRPKIWSAGSSRGAEAYSVAMMIEDIAPGTKAQIFGSDLDKKIIAQATAGGPYPDAEAKNISPSLRARFMEQKSDGHYVTPEIRSKVKFKEQNLLTDRFDRDFDLIMCRNVVIYFSDEAKHGLNQKFSAALKPDGILFIGGTETILNPRDFGFERDAAAFYRKSTPAAQISRAA